MTEVILSGLRRYDEFLTSERVRTLLQIIDQYPWQDTKGALSCVGCSTSRIVQQYGYKYNYLRRQVTHNDYLGVLPEWLFDIATDIRVLADDIPIFDQCIINRYEPGQGISPHIDCQPCFDDIIATVSLYDNRYDPNDPECNWRSMQFDRVKKSPTQANRLHVPMKQGSLVIMSGEARNQWLHSYKNTSSIVRTSLTFRKVKL